MNEGISGLSYDGKEAFAFILKHTGYSEATDL
jgi:hypothetical protein